MLILGIESSCDETAAALVEDGRTILSSVIASQIDTHRSFGGVVPELASREHLRNIGYVVNQAFKEARREYADIDGIAVTQGPGTDRLSPGGALLRQGHGVCPAETARARESHRRAHLFGLPGASRDRVPDPCARGLGRPHFADTAPVSPALTSSSAARGTTRPAKPWTSCEVPWTRLSRRARDRPSGAGRQPASLCLLGAEDQRRQPRFQLQRIQDRRAAVTYRNRGSSPAGPGGRPSRRVLDLVASYQHMIVHTLASQTRKAAERLRPPSILLVGGVACNSLLRRTFSDEFERVARVYYPSPALTTDNAAMIAAAGTPRLASAPPAPPLDLNAFADLRLC